jgi:hypothetical protein
MQFVEYWPKEYFKLLKFYVKNARWRQNPKWRPKHKKKLYFAAKWPIFNGFQKRILFVLFVELASTNIRWVCWKRIQDGGENRIKKSKKNGFFTDFLCFLVFLVQKGKKVNFSKKKSSSQNLSLQEILF